MPTLPVPEPKGPPPTVVFVYASPRSGTTLIGDLLGLHPQVRYAGELNRLPLRLATSRGNCACRQPYLDCAFWQQIRDAPGALVGHRRGDDVEQARSAEIRRQAVRPGALVSAWMRRPTTAQRRYVEILTSLYADLAAVGPAEPASVLIETSKKNLIDLFILRSCGQPVRVIHLVRRPAAVVASRVAAGQRRNAGSDPPLWRRAYVGLVVPVALRYSVAWDSANAVGPMVLRRLDTPVRVLRYEDLVADPRSVTAELLAELGLDSEPIEGAFVDERTVNLGESHSMDGNPHKRQRGAVHISEDDRWRDLTAPVRWLVTALSAPVARPLGYRSEPSFPDGPSPTQH